MKKYILFLLITIITFYTGSSVYGQNIPTTEEEVQKELEKRGLTEEEVSKALLENGIDPDQLENATPEQLIEIQKILKKLEEDKKANIQSAEENENKDIVLPKDTLKIEKKKTEDFKKDNTIVLNDPKIYGHDILSKFIDSNENLNRVNENYILGHGDRVSISIWSNSQFDKTFEIDRDGYIKIETQGIKKRIYLRGLTLDKARKKIIKTLSNYLVFRTGDYNISLESSRNINISIYGEVNKPGSFSTKATKTVFEGITYAQGVTDIASVRYIKIIKPTGDNSVFDLYKYLENPEYKSGFFLGDNDIIHVPVANKLVSISGAIKRNFTFELKENEGLKELVSYAGGFEKDAIKSKIQLVRYIDNKKIFIEIDLFNKNGKLKDFSLKDGDSLFVNKITTEFDNFVKVVGSVYNPGKFEITDNMKISDILLKAGLKPDAKTDFAMVTRRNDDGTKMYISVNIDKVLKNIGNKGIDFRLKNTDLLTVYSKNRYSDDIYITIEGAVRVPKKYTYGSVESLTVSEAIKLAGGLARDASQIAVLHRQDPLKPFEKQYIKIDLQKLMKNVNTKDNIKLKPFDKLEVLTENSFNEKTFVIINGAVNRPDTFQYGKGMTLNDLLVLAGGFKLEAATNNIEVSRVLIKNNKPTEVTVAKINMDKFILKSNNDKSSFVLEPFDIVMVRTVPEFEMQKMITIKGEVRYPGEYTLISNNEKISDVISRAGGLSEEAFAEGSTIYRNEDNIGFIVLNLKEALKNKSSKFNYILKSGDIIEVPKQRDFVTIQGAIRADEKYKDKIAYNKTGINVPYHKGKRAMYYIDNYAGGVDKNASKGNIIVEHPNGEIAKTLNYGLFRIYPKVRKGSVIKVNYKKKKKKGEKGEKDIDWNKIISDSVAQISTIMTLVILFKSISQ